MAAVEQINRASQLQASATQQASTALVQIEKGAKLMDGSIREADERIRTAGAELKAGRQAVEKLVGSVRAGLGDTRESIVIAARLGVASRKIEKIVDSIALIGVQTSMLAVSGSVEAARAADSGQGFANVSSEIRKLAREASANVEQAKDGVRGILEQITILRSDLEQIATGSEAEVQNNRAISGLLERVEQDVSALGTANERIVASAADILSAAGETGAGSRQIAAAAEEAGAAAREAATAATQQSQTAEDLAAAIEEIASLADDLKRAHA
jgi:methyl-accepting chemotaxis protein